MILVGNSCHTTDHRMITKKEAQELAQSLDLEYFETSVEDYINVSEIFERLLDKITSAGKNCYYVYTFIFNYQKVY